MLITPHAPPFKAMKRRARIFRLTGASASSVRAGNVNQLLKDYTYIFACGTCPPASFRSLTLSHSDQ